MAMLHQEIDAMFLSRDRERIIVGDPLHDFDGYHVELYEKPVAAAA